MANGNMSTLWTTMSFPELDATVREVQAGPTVFGGYVLFNPNTDPVYVQVFVAPIADIVVGTTTAQAVYGIPAGSGANLEFSRGVMYPTGLCIAATTTQTGAAPPAIPVTANVLYR